MHVRDEPGVEAHQREHDILDARLHVALADGIALEGLLAGKPQDHRHVVGSERPERVLVLAVLAEVQPVRVDVVHVAELAGAHQLAELLNARVILEQVTDHQDAVGCPRGLDEGLRLRSRAAHRLLDKAVLPGFEHPRGELCVGRHRRGHHHGVERVVGEQVVERARGARRREGRPPALERLLGRVAEPGQLRVGKPVEIAGEVRSPVAEADHPDARHSRTRFDASMPRVTPRKSTTTGASRTTRSRSSPG